MSATRFVCPQQPFYLTFTVADSATGAVLRTRRLRRAAVLPWKVADPAPSNEHMGIWAYGHMGIWAPPDHYERYTNQ